MITNDELMLAQRFLSVTFVALRKATNLSQTILVSLFQYLHLSLESVQPDGLISSKATSGISNLFNLSAFHMRKLSSQSKNTSRIGFEKCLELSRLGLSVIQIRNRFSLAS